MNDEMKPVLYVEDYLKQIHRTSFKLEIIVCNEDKMKTECMFFEQQPTDDDIKKALTEKLSGFEVEDGWFVSDIILSQQLYSD